MPRPRTSMSAIQRPEQSAQLERRVQRFRELKRGLDQLEYFCKGTVLKRMMKCGKAGCACAADPENRQCEALAGSGSPLQGRLPAISKAEGPAQSPREAVKDHPPIPGQAGSMSAARLMAKTGGITITRLLETAERDRNYVKGLILRCLPVVLK